MLGGREFRRHRQRCLDIAGQKTDLLGDAEFLAVLFGSGEKHFAQMDEAEDGNDGDRRPDEAGFVVELVVEQLADGFVLLNAGFGLLLHG